jgi:ribosomal protein L17
MKTTKYFDFRRKLPDREHIKDSWIKYVLSNPEKTVIQDDGRMKTWAKIKEAENRYLRVITLADRETVHNAFFDRNFKG